MVLKLELNMGLQSYRAFLKRCQLWVWGTLLHLTTITACVWLMFGWCMSNKSKSRFMSKIPLWFRLVSSWEDTIKSAWRLLSENLEECRGRFKILFRLSGTIILSILRENYYRFRACVSKTFKEYSIVEYLHVWPEWLHAWTYSAACLQLFPNPRTLGWKPKPLCW